MPITSAPERAAIEAWVDAARGRVLVAGGQTMEGLARNFGSRAGRPVFDRTGIQGSFDVTLNFSVDPGGSADAPPFVTALQEQLGLKTRARPEKAAALCDRPDDALLLPRAPSPEHLQPSRRPARLYVQQRPGCGTNTPPRPSVLELC